MCEDALEFPNSLLTVEMAQSQASKPFWGVCDCAGEVAIKAHSVKKGGCCAALNLIEVAVGQGCGW